MSLKVGLLISLKVGRKSFRSRDIKIYAFLLARFFEIFSLKKEVHILTVHKYDDRIFLLCNNLQALHCFWLTSGDILRLFCGGIFSDKLQIFAYF